MKKLIAILSVAGLIAAMQGCYKNKYDVTEFTKASIEAISLTKDVAPILTSGGCGCHNNGTTRQFLFSKGDTIYYETMVAKSAMLNKMANGENHPAEGTVMFTPSQAAIVKRWVAQGAKNDNTPPVGGNITYSQHILPITKISCSGGQCHGGSAPVLDYTILKANEAVLRPMMTSLGQQGHPIVVPVSQATATSFLAWMDGGWKY
jgi:hypothetical protein